MTKNQKQALETIVKNRSKSEIHEMRQGAGMFMQTNCVGISPTGIIQDPVSELVPKKNQYQKK